MHIDFESIAIMAGTYWMIFRAFTSLPAEHDRKHTTDRRRY